MPKFCDSEEEEEDEDDTLVVLGTPLPTYAEDEVPIRKPVSVQEQVVKDSEGRVRFHGAFTGGFSAGYFNSVSTKEGWVPKSFVSSRSQRADVSQKPEDYMDDEDFSEFGIAPRKLATTDKFSSSAGASSSATTQSGGAMDYLTSLVSLKKLSIGLQLLRKMGWRDNQGIGPRTKRKRRRPQPEHKSKKTYGCALPPPEFMEATGISKVAANDVDDDDESEDDDAGYLENVTFAPCDVCPISFKVKDNLHGLGYQPLDPRVALGHVLTQDVPVGNDGPAAIAGRSKKGTGIRGQAFGVGAFEDEDDDIYKVDSMTNYDLELGTAPRTGRNFNWTAPKHGVHDVGRAAEVKAIGGSHLNSAISGFHRAPVSLKPRQQYPAPELPRGFRPFHTFVQDLVPQSEGKVGEGEEKEGTGRKTKQTVFSRANELGETPNTRSVFELISSEDRCRIEAAKMTADRLKSADQNSSTSNTTPTTTVAFTPFSIRPSTSNAVVDFTPTSISHLTPFTSMIDITPASLRQSTSTVDSPAATPTADLSVQESGVAVQEVSSLSQFTSTPLSIVKALQDKFTAAGTAAESTGREMSPALNTSSGFKPFVRDPEKQKRYEQFLECMKSNRPYVVEMTAEVRDMTEWEREREREEFSRAAHLYRPLSSIITSRFTTAVYDDNDANNKDTYVAKVEKSSQEKAADMKMFGKLSRQTEEWHPDKLLCKRFNIANPYPESTVVGLLTAKREKSSFFDFLSFSGPSDSPCDRPEASSSSVGPTTPTLQSIAKNSTKKAKPLAILSKVDLRPIARSSNQSEAVGSTVEHDGNPVAIESTPSSSSTAPLSQTFTEPSEQSQRPSLDLFKAIFDNSDDDSGSGEENNSANPRKKLFQTGQKQQELNSQQQQQQQQQQNDLEEPFKEERSENDLNGKMGGGQGNMNQQVVDDTEARIKLEAEDGVSPAESHSYHGFDTTDDSALYGPSLPSSARANASTSVRTDASGRANPATSLALSDCESETNRKYAGGSSIERTTGSSSRHKHKVKKSKSKKKKKHKHKSKKTKKSKTRLSSSSGSDADSESNSDDDSKLSDTAHIDKELLTRLRRLDQDKRMKAADFFR